MANLQERLEKVVLRAGVVTYARLVSDAKVYRSCKKKLGTEPSERFAPAFAAATKACRQFRKAGVQLAKAASNMDVDLGGSSPGRRRNVSSTALSGEAPRLRATP